MPHIHEKIDFTISVFIVHNNKVLLRKHDKYNIWLGVGGHIELDENPNEAALRETKEEVGLEVQLICLKELPVYSRPNHKELIPPEYMNIHNINESHQHVDLIFFATSNSDQVIPENKDDVWEWFNANEIDNNKYDLREDIVFYAKKALELASQIK